jgi:hypothetical protein
MKRKFFCCLMVVAASTAALAQGGTKSPYSQFGLGVLSDESQGMSRGMNGTGIALRRGSEINTLNPASYSGVDSLTMLFDAGVALQKTSFKEKSVRQNVSMGNFEYVVGSFRLLSNVGLAFGLLPVTGIGYSYTTSTYLDNTNGSIVESYTGSGGLHQAFLGVGVNLLKPLSVGVNVGYLWGDINRSVISSSTTYINSLKKEFSASVKSYKLDVGVQWEQPVGKTDKLTVGATVGIGHNLGTNPELTIVNTNSVSARSDTTSYSIDNAFHLPMSYGVGLSYFHNYRLTVAADAQLQKWGELDFPYFNSSQSKFEQVSGLLKDRLRLSGGVDWLPNPLGRHYLSHVHYRMGVGYSTPYYYIEGKDGPKEFSVSAGIGMPIANMYNNRSILNISGQWVRTSAPGMITENTFRINIGLTFNERWFAKWKVE